MRASAPAARRRARARASALARRRSRARARGSRPASSSSARDALGVEHEHVLAGDERVEREPVGDVAGAVDDRVPEALVLDVARLGLGAAASASARATISARWAASRARRRGARRRRRRRRAAPAPARSSLQLGRHVALRGEREQQVEPAVAAPVAHAGRAAVADPDQPRLLQPLERLAHRVAARAELLGQPPLGRHGGAGRERAGEDVGAQAGVDAIGQEHWLDQLGATGCTRSARRCARSTLMQRYLGGRAAPPRRPRLGVQAIIRQSNAPLCLATFPLPAGAGRRRRVGRGPHPTELVAVRDVVRHHVGREERRYPLEDRQPVAAVVHQPVAGDRRDAVGDGEPCSGVVRDDVVADEPHGILSDPDPLPAVARHAVADDVDAAHVSSPVWMP